MTTITKKIVDGFVPIFLRRFLGGKRRPSLRSVEGCGSNGQKNLDDCFRYITLSEYFLSTIIIVIQQRKINYLRVGRAFSRVCLFVCLFVRALKRKRLELSTPNLVHIYSIVVARHSLTQRSKCQSSRSHGYGHRHGRTVTSDVCCCCRRGSACRYDCIHFLVYNVFDLR